MATRKPTEKKKKPGFDQILGELQKVVDALERGDLPLEKALSAFEKGVGLSREAERILTEAERRVDVLMQSREGVAVEEFDTGHSSGPEADGSS